jgi:hypothetical protein
MVPNGGIETAALRLLRALNDTKPTTVRALR